MKVCDDMLASGKQVPGFGHEYFTYTDPRLLHLKQFTDKTMQDN